MKFSSLAGGVEMPTASSRGFALGKRREDVMRELDGLVDGICLLCICDGCQAD